MKKTLFILLSFSFTVIQAQKPYLISSQDEKFPLYTSVDTTKLQEIKEEQDSLWISNVRAYLKPMVLKGDPLAQYYYAQSYDYYPHVLIDESNRDSAVFYYHKAADKHLAEAEKFLYYAYRYSFLKVKYDEEKSLEYLNRYTQHGSNLLKVNGYEQWAGLYYGGEYNTFIAVKHDEQKAIQYLKMALALNPKDYWAIDFLAGIYEEQELYNESVEWLLKSDNIQSWLKVAEWMIEGEKVTKNVSTGVEIIYVSIKAIQGDEEEFPEDYMGAVNPIYLLNELYKCRKLITKEQAGNYLLEYYHCD